MNFRNYKALQFCCAAALLFFLGTGLGHAKMSTLASFSIAFQNDPAYDAFKKARDLMYDDKFRDAISAFQNLIKKYPTSKYLDQSHFWVAYSLEKTGNDLEKAFAAYKKVDEDFSNSRWADDAHALIGG